MLTSVDKIIVTVIVLCIALIAFGKLLGVDAETIKAFTTTVTGAIMFLIGKKAPTDF